MRFKPIEHRILISHGVNGDKKNLAVVGAHFSHVAHERSQHWRHLRDELAYFPYDSVVSIVDPNMLIIPA